MKKKKPPFSDLEPGDLLVAKPSATLEGSENAYLVLTTRIDGSGVRISFWNLGWDKKAEGFYDADERLGRGWSIVKLKASRGSTTRKRGKTR